MSAEAQTAGAAAISDEPTVAAAPAIAARLFGWMMLALMGAYLLNVILTFWVGLPGIGPILGWQGNGDGGIVLSILQALIYLALPAFAYWRVTKTRDRTLRQDATQISDGNAFFIRACFWIVFLVGLTDAAVSFMRVEGLLEVYFGEEMAGDLGRSQFRGPVVHVPVALLGVLIASVTRSLGFHWLALLVVFAELIIVFSRFIFSYEQAFMADLVRFWYGALFLFASAYTLLDDGHVRVDLFYAAFRRSKKGQVNGWGAILLGIPLCWTILLVGMWSKSSAIVAPILVFEVTQAGFGMYVKYLMAAFLGVFAISMMIQFVSQFLDAVADRRGEPGGHEPHPEMM
ncbi:MAG: permease [Pseudomonadota bacterium]